MSYHICNGGIKYSLYNSLALSSCDVLTANTAVDMSTIGCNETSIPHHQRHEKRNLTHAAHRIHSDASFQNENLI